MDEGAYDVRGSNVLIVDDVPENLHLLATVLKRGDLVPRPVTSGRRAIEASVIDPPDLILLDVDMPEMSGLEVCRRFKRDERLPNIPIIFISGLQGTDDKVEAYRAGGIDYVSKPFQDQEVLVRVKTHLRLRKLQAKLASHNSELEQRVTEQARSTSQMAIIFAFAKLAEARDDDTGRHMERIRTFGRMLAGQMRTTGLHVADLTTTFIDNLHQTAALHDIGKVDIPDAILLKPGKLTPEEFVEMKKHSAIGANTLATVLEQYTDNRFLRMGVDVARSHHKKWDGSGYPDNLKRAAIPLAVRIVAAADFYDALTSKRCCRPATSHEDACRMIRKSSGTHFDLDVVAAFSTLDGQFRHTRHAMQS